MKNELLALPLLAAAAVLIAGCAASSSGGTPGAPASATTPTSSGAPASPADSSSGSTGTGTVASGAPACESANLKASLGGGAGPGMSQNHTGLQLVNTGPASCMLYGYPGVSWVAGADGHQVGAAATRQPDVGGAEATVTLAPGATASAPLDIVDAAVFPPSACKPVPVRGLRVYPPGETAALFIPLPTSTGGYGECSAVTQQPTLIIGYMQPGVQPG